MVKPIDVSKFRKDITKSIPGISTGFNDPTSWVSTGNFTLNKLISGHFKKGVPMGKVTMFAGQSSSGKSYIVSGSMVRNAQQQGIFCILLDTENALDEEWLKAVGVDTSPEKLLRVSVSLVDDVAKILSDFIKGYKVDYDGIGRDDRPRVMIVIDSLGMLLTHTDIAQFQSGDLKGDMGRKAKALRALVTNLINMVGDTDIGVVCTNHTYASQDMYNPDDKISGGNGPIFASSIVIAMRPKKLKEDSEGNKVTDVVGIMSSCKVVKTRYAKPFESVDIHIPYDTGMDPYSGLFDFFLKLGVLKKSGNRYAYTSKVTGKEYLEFRKHWTNEMLELVMDEFDDEVLSGYDVEIEESVVEGE